jgi:hypothetical protein
MSAGHWQKYQSRPQVEFHKTIDHECFSHNEVARNKSPITAVETVVSIVSHREVTILGNDNVIAFHEFLKPERIASTLEDRELGFGRKIIRESPKFPRVFLCTLYGSLMARH